MRFAQAALVTVLCLSPGTLWARPKWTRAKPHFETRAGRIFAVAVGKAKDQNAELARVAAAELARADLLRLIQGKPQGASVEGEVKGAQVAEVYNARSGVVYVRLELETAPKPPPRGP
jgi:hypothetical protein